MRRAKEQQSSSSSEFGPIWKRKIRTLHARLDIDGDGLITQNDFDVMVERFDTIGHATPRQLDKLRTLLDKMWTDILAPLAADGPITADAYIAALMRQGFKGKSRTTFGIYSQFFDVIDTNYDGHISFPEFLIYWQVMGVDTSYAKESYDAIDADQDGEVSKAEYLLAAERFFCGNEPSNFWGPLAD